MGPIPVPVSQFRPPLPDTNPNIRKNNAVEKRKRVTPKKFRPATPKPTTAHPPLSKAQLKPKNGAPLPSIPACESTPWPGTDQVKSGNLFEDRNWLLCPNYLDNAKENKTENELKATTNVTSPKPQITKEKIKTGEQPTE